MNLHSDAAIVRDGFHLRIKLDATPGSITGLAGGIGSGKSSVLSLIAGILRAADGRLALGDDVWDEPATERFVASRPIGLLSQRFQSDLAEDRTGVENVVDAFPTPHADGDPEATARHLLSEFGVEDHVVDRLPWTFSGAEAQRVALVRALAPAPSVVLLDEPLSALDKRTRATVLQRLHVWLDGYEGIAIIASTDDGVLDRLASEVIHLPAG